MHSYVRALYVRTTSYCGESNKRAAFPICAACNPQPTHLFESQHTTSTTTLPSGCHHPVRRNVAHLQTPAENWQPCRAGRRPLLSSPSLLPRPTLQAAFNTLGSTHQHPISCCWHPLAGRRQSGDAHQRHPWSALAGAQHGVLFRASSFTFIFYNLQSSIKTPLWQIYNQFRGK